VPSEVDAIMTAEASTLPANDIKLLTSNSTRSVLDALAPLFELETGYRLGVHFDSAKIMLARIKSGETADVVVLGESAVDELVKLGRVSAQSRRPFARSRVGIAVRAGMPHPDVGTLDALRRTLLAARSIAHTVNGLSGMYVPTLLERLGIADEMRPKTVTRTGGLIGRVVVTGEAEIAVQQISELLQVPGIELVGPLPDEVQKTFESAAGIFADTQRRRGAEALLQFFAASASAAVFEAKGLESVAGNSAVHPTRDRVSP
jgi:molybdate transport system substrate-binding protein